MGGHYRMAIETIICIKSKIHYQILCEGIKAIDKMIHGWYVTKYMKKSGLSDLGRKLIMDLIEYGVNDDNIQVDDYIKNTFTAWTMNQTHIVFNLHELGHYNQDKDLLYLLMEEISEDDEKVTDKRNLFRDNIFEIFQNVQKIEIYTSQWQGKYFHMMDFNSFYCIRIF